MFQIAGYGPKAYFQVQWSIIKMLMFVTLLVLPVIYVFYTANSDEHDSRSFRTFLGNMGST